MNFDRGKGDYKSLLVYKKASIIFEITYYFCENFLQQGDRTKDQMIQAARSGKQNIVEGCASGVISLKNKIFLINVGKSSFKELLEDYEDYLVVHNHRKWEDGSIEQKAMRGLASKPENDKYIVIVAKNRSPDVIANMMIVLLNQTDYLLFKFLKKLEEEYKKQRLP